MSALYFAIIGKDDKPLFELNLGPPGRSARTEEFDRQKQFILHSALDVIESAQYESTAFYLPDNPVDSFNDYSAFAFVTAGYVKFVVLVERVMGEGGSRGGASASAGEGQNAFFEEVYETYLKWTMNPFYKYNSRIDSETFLAKMKSISRKHLGV